MEDDLDAWELVGVVAKEEEAIVVIQMFTKQFHDSSDYHFNDIAFFDELSGLEEEQECEGRARC